MWAGVVVSLATLKFSTSPSKLGEIVTKVAINMQIIRAGFVSFVMK